MITATARPRGCPARVRLSNNDASRHIDTRPSAQEHEPKCPVGYLLAVVVVDPSALRRGRGGFAAQPDRSTSATGLSSWALLYRRGPRVRECVRERSSLHKRHGVATKSTTTAV
jgi:hypothetical protein